MLGQTLDKDAAMMYVQRLSFFRPAGAGEAGWVLCLLLGFVLLNPGPPTQALVRRQASFLRSTAARRQLHHHPSIPVVAVPVLPETPSRHFHHLLFHPSFIQSTVRILATHPHNHTLIAVQWAFLSSLAPRLRWH